MYPNQAIGERQDTYARGRFHYLAPHRDSIVFARYGTSHGSMGGSKSRASTLIIFGPPSQRASLCKWTSFVGRPGKRASRTGGAECHCDREFALGSVFREVAALW